jgi:glycosyltransferase involved in cell wall biosynthesis
MINTAFVTEDGTTFRMKQILKLLVHRYHTYALVLHYTNDKKAVQPLEGVTIRILPGKFYLYHFLLYPYAFLQAIRIRPDIVYMVNDGGYFDFYHFLTKLLGVPLVFEVHSICSKETADRGGREDLVRKTRAYESEVIPNADHIVALSEEVEEFYRPLNPRITVIPAIVKEEKVKARGTTPSSDGTKTVGIIGPFHSLRNKGELNFIYENLAMFDSRIRFKVIGACPEKLDDPRIEYTGFLKSKQEFLDAVAALDAVLVPSRMATFGPLTKIIEPLMCGVPVFTTPKGAIGISHLVDGVNIFITEEDGFVERVNHALFDDALMRRTGEEGKRTIHEYFSAEANSKKLYQLLDELMASK